MIYIYIYIYTYFIYTSSGQHDTMLEITSSLYTCVISTPNRFMDGCGMQVPTFAVAASCADGYEGDANVEA